MKNQTPNTPESHSKKSSKGKAVITTAAIALSTVFWSPEAKAHFPTTNNNSMEITINNKSQKSNDTKTYIIENWEKTPEIQFFERILGIKIPAQYQEIFTYLMNEKNSKIWKLYIQHIQQAISNYKWNLDKSIVATACATEIAISLWFDWDIWDIYDVIDDEIDNLATNTLENMNNNLSVRMETYEKWREKVKEDKEPTWNDIKEIYKLVYLPNINSIETLKWKLFNCSQSEKEEILKEYWDTF